MPGRGVWPLLLLALAGCGQAPPGPAPVSVGDGAVPAAASAAAGADAPAATRSPAPASAAGAPVDPAPSPTGVPAPLPDIPQESARLEDQQQAAEPAPTSVRIPAMDVAADIVPVGVDDATGQMAVPPSGDLVAWYRHGPEPGLPGSAVLAAHVDFAGREGVFFDLGDLQSGDLVSVSFEDGTARDFSVVANESYVKTELPLAEVFRRDGPATLTLVTCDGAFDQDARSYIENRVISAVPVG